MNKDSVDKDVRTMIGNRIRNVKGVVTRRANFRR